MEAKFVIPLILGVLSASVVMFIAMWKYVSSRKVVTKEDYDTHVEDFKSHKDKVVYKANCRPTVEGIKAEIAGIGNFVKAQFESNEKLEQQKMDFYKEQIGYLVKNDEHLIKKVDELLRK